MRKIKLKIKKMRCLDCSLRMEQAMEALSFIRSVQTDFALSTCEMEYEGELPRRKLEAAIRAAGFKIDQELPV